MLLDLQKSALIHKCTASCKIACTISARNLVLSRHFGWNRFVLSLLHSVRHDQQLSSPAPLDVPLVPLRRSSTKENERKQIKNVTDSFIGTPHSHTMFALDVWIHCLPPTICGMCFESLDRLENMIR